MVYGGKGVKRSADGGKERPSFVKREAYLASQETRSPAKDEREETNDELAGGPATHREMLDRKTLNSFLSLVQTYHRVLTGY